MRLKNCPGELDYLQWVSPLGKDCGYISVKELHELPFKVLIFGYPLRGGLYAMYMKSFPLGESTDIWVCANFELGAELHTRIARLCYSLRGHSEDRESGDWVPDDWEPTAISKLLDSIAGTREVLMQADPCPPKGWAGAGVGIRIPRLSLN